MSFQLTIGTEINSREDILCEIAESQTLKTRSSAFLKRKLERNSFIYSSLSMLITPWEKKKKSIPLLNMCSECFKNVLFHILNMSFFNLDLLKADLLCICVSWLINFLTVLHYHLLLALHIYIYPSICSVFCQRCADCCVQLWNQQDHKLLGVFLLHLGICYKTSRNVNISKTSIVLLH